MINIESVLFKALTKLPFTFKPLKKLFIYPIFYRIAALLGYVVASFALTKIIAKLIVKKV